MTYIQRKSALKAFYYLMAVDGSVDDEELELFDHIGEELDSEHFRGYRQQVIQSCENRLRSYSDDDRYDVIAEGADEAISHRVDNDEDGIPSRLLLWDMLAAAYADGNYDAYERKLIRHIARTVVRGRSLYPEMEHLMRAAQSVREERAWITSTDRPYAEVKPVVDALEEREVAIQRAATQLVADEMVPPAPVVMTVEKDVFDIAKENMDKAAAPVVNQVQQGVNQVQQGAQQAAEAVRQAAVKVPGAAQVGGAVNSAAKAVGDVLNPAGDEIRKQADNAAREAKKQMDNATNAVKGFMGGLFGGKR